jgi:glycosyltransferase involved in cell wall biosynthesis
MKKLKIAVYAIAKNEAKHVARFCEAAKEADMIIIADTGSEDDTVKLAKKHGATVHNILVTPWRFDVARNAALSLVPGDVDVCVSMDLDEILQPGWRKVIEDAWKDDTTRIAYNFDNGGGSVFMQNKIHARAGYAWKWICHEWPMPYRITEVCEEVDFIMAKHKPDLEKSRKQYLDLMYACAIEEPDSARHSMYYGRELYGQGYYEQAVDEFTRLLSLKECIDPADRGYAYRALSRASHYLGNSEDALMYARKCTLEDPRARESWCVLAWECAAQELWNECLSAAMTALNINERANMHHYESGAWSYVPHELAAKALAVLGMNDLAKEHEDLAESLKEKE